MAFEKIHFTANDTDKAQAAKRRLVHRYGQVSVKDAEVIVPLGGDGFMLSTLHAAQSLTAPVYGMHQGTVGFLMNEYAEGDLPARIAAAERAAVHPLKMQVLCMDGTMSEALAINEVSLLRSGPQAAKLRISVNGQVRMDSLVCDGALVSTPAGSTAYNYSAHGPILPIDANILALTAVAAFRPRRWRGALLPMDAKIRIEVLEPQKRPVSAVADSSDVKDVVRVDIEIEPDITHELMFDPGHGLEERLLNEQFQ